MNRDGIYEHLSILSEPLRVRLLHLLQREELGVGELTRILQVPQSTVSRHLKALDVGGWVARRSEGTATWIRMAHERLPTEALELWRVVADSPTHAQVFGEDEARLEGVLAARRIDSAEFFGRVGPEWDSLRRALFGEGFAVPALLGLVPGDWVVADLGCGTGAVTEALAPAVGRVVAVDREEAMLEAARRRLAGFSNVELHRADLRALPVADEALDAALCMLVLHHLDAPAEALAETRRALRPGGRVIVLDMVEHDRENYRSSMGHRHLGFSREVLAGHAAEAGLVLDDYRTLPREVEAQGPALFVARLRRPASDPSAS